MTKASIILDDLADDEAWALAQMCKRTIWADFKRLSANRLGHDDLDLATIKLRRGHVEIGFEPR